MLLHLQTPHALAALLAGQVVTLGVAAGGDDAHASALGRELPPRRPQPGTFVRAMVTADRSPRGCSGARVRTGDQSAARPGGPLSVLGDDAHPLVLRLVATTRLCALVKSLIGACLSLDTVCRRSRGCTGWPRAPTGTSRPTSASRLVGRRSDHFGVRAVEPRQTPPTARARWFRRSAPTCSTSTARSTSPGRRPSVEASRRARCCRRAEPRRSVAR